MILRGLALVSVCLVAYLLYLPLPDGYEEPWKTRLFMYTMGAMNTMISAVNTLGGYDHPLRLFQILGEKFAPQTRMQPMPGLKVTDETFDGVRVRVYDPEGREANSPAVVYFHGGGWVLLNIDMFDPLVQHLSLKTNMLFVSVEYRLAPDYKYPTPVDDCMTAVKYFFKNAAAYKVNPKRIAVAGDSAGGHLAAVISMKLRDENFPTRPISQILIYPGMQAFNFNGPSFKMYEHMPILNKRLVLTFWSLFHLGEAKKNDIEILSANRHVSLKMMSKYSARCNTSLIPEQYLKGYQASKRQHVEAGSGEYKHLEVLYTDPYRSPLLADDLSGLPKAYVLTAEVDPIRDDGLMYASRLRQAGIDVIHHHYFSSFHGFISIPVPFLKVWRTATDDLVSYMMENV